MSAAHSQSEAPSGAPRRGWGLDITALSVVALLVRIPAYLAPAHLSFDDAVYGASAIAMRRGGLPFRDVFSSQGPLHLPIVFAGDLLGRQSASSPRLAATLSGIVAAAAVYAAARRLTARSGALIAGVVVALSGSVLWTTGPITADGPAIALGAVALTLSLRYRDSPRMQGALTTGAVLGAALSVKAPLVLATTIPVAGFLLFHRRARDIVVAASGAAAVGLAATVPWGIGRVWDQSVAYQISSERNASERDNAVKIISTLWERDPFMLALASLAIAAGITALIRSRQPTPDVGLSAPAGQPGPQQPVRLAGRLLAAWLIALLIFLVIEPALWRNHVAHLIAPAALLVALHPPPVRIVALAAMIVIPFQASNLGDILSPAPYSGDAATAVAALRSLPEHALAISDDPGFVWRSGRATPFDLVDTSVKRIQQGMITTTSVADAADDPHVCAVLVWSRSQFGSLDGLPEALWNEGYSRALRFGDDRVLYERPSCTPPH